MSRLNTNRRARAIWKPTITQFFGPNVIVGRTAVEVLAVCKSEAERTRYEDASSQYAIFNASYSTRRSKARCSKRSLKDKAKNRAT
jgi:hypothetical protein